MQTLDPQLATTFTNLRSTIVLLASVAVVALAIHAALRHLPEFGFRVRAWFRGIRLQFTGVKYEARLNEVACRVCRKGTGVYDPIHITHRGIQYIEGTCNCCGSYVRARLN